MANKDVTHQNFLPYTVDGKNTCNFQKAQNESNLNTPANKTLNT